MTDEWWLTNWFQSPSLHWNGPCCGRRGVIIMNGQRPWIMGYLISHNGVCWVQNQIEMTLMILNSELFVFFPRAGSEYYLFWHRSPGLLFSKKNLGGIIVCDQSPLVDHIIASYWFSVECVILLWSQSWLLYDTIDPVIVPVLNVFC